MNEVLFLLVLAGVWILIASIRDLQVREVPNWLSFSLIIFALGYRFFYSFFLEPFSMDFFSYSLLLTIVFFGFPYSLYLFLRSKRLVLLKFFKTNERIEYFSIFLISCFFILWIILDYINGFASLIFAEGGLMFFYSGLIGFGVFFILGNLFYYGRVFAGGDAKLLIALGAILSLSNSFILNLKYFSLFVTLLLLVGSFYGIIWSFFLSLSNFKSFKKKFSKLLKKYQRSFFPLFCFGIFLLFLSFIELYFVFFGILLLLFPILYIYAKSIDEVSMIKNIKVENLAEGDWLVSDLKIGRKIIYANWEGLNKKEIELIKKHYKSIKIRQGIPFVPVFFISYCIFVYLFYNGLDFFSDLVSLFNL